MLDNIKNPQNVPTGSPRPENPIFQISQNFSDIDEFIELVRNWDLDFKQLKPGKFRSHLRQFICPGFQFGSVDFNQHLDQRGSSPPGMWTLALPKNSHTIIWRGREVKDCEVLVYHPGSEIGGMNLPDFQVYTLSLPDDYLDQIAQSLGWVSFLEMIGNSDRLKVQEEIFYHFRNFLQQLATYLFSLQASPQYFSLPGLMDDMQTELQQVFRGVEKQLTTIPKVRIKVIQELTEYIEIHGEESLTIQELCSVSGMSERSLQYAFKDRFGVSPKAYLQAFRLHRVHQELRRAKPGTKVMEVAGKWGFWHMGQFAADYRKFFEQLPSTTLQHAEG